MNICTFVYLDHDVSEDFVQEIVTNIKRIQALGDIESDLFITRDINPQVTKVDDFIPYFKDRKFNDSYCIQVCPQWEDCTNLYANRFSKYHPNIVDYCPFGLHVLTAAIEINGVRKGIIASEAFLSETPTPEELLHFDADLKEQMVSFLPNQDLTKLKTFYDILGHQLQNAFKIYDLTNQLKEPNELPLKEANQITFTNATSILTPALISSELDDSFNYEKIKGLTASETIQSCLAYMHQNYLNKISLKKVADTIHVNPQYLSRLFKRETGHNFVDYLNILRIRYACRLLKKTTYPIYRIASESGFSDAPYFTRVFRKHVGQLPGDFRKDHIILHRKEASR